jgi:hypothetical protein
MLAKPTVGSFVSAQLFVLWGLTLILPQSFLANYPLLKGLLQMVERVVPTIQPYVDHSAFPDVAESLLCLGWCLAPLNLVCVGYWVCLGFRGGTSKLFGTMESIKPPDASWLGFVATCILGAVGLPVLAWFLLRINPGIDMFGSDVSRISFGFVAQAVSSFSGIYLGMAFILVVKIVAAVCLFFTRRRRLNFDLPPAMRGTELAEYTNKDRP